MATITLKNMRFFAHHGCFENERLVGTHFEVDLTFDFESQQAEQSDTLSDTVDYQMVYHEVRAQMQQSAHLLEHLTRRIADAVKQRFTQVENLRVEVRKLNPALGGDVGSVGCLLTE